MKSIFALIPENVASGCVVQTFPTAVWKAQSSAKPQLPHASEAATRHTAITGQSAASTDKYRNPSPIDGN
jgi:hypothetical protein